MEGQGSPITAIVQYKTTSILRIIVSNTSVSKREKITIRGLELVARPSAIPGPILRLGGRMIPSIDDFSALGTLVNYTIPPVGFKAIVAGADNTLVSDDVAAVQLLSDSTAVGQNDFNGDGVVAGFNFKPSFAKIGSHAVSLTYTNDQGCKSINTRTIRVYNHAKAINGLDTLYCTNFSKVKLKKINFDGSSSLESLVVVLMGTNSLVDQATAASTLTFANGVYTFDPTKLHAAGELAKQNKTLPPEGGSLVQLKFSAQYRNSTGQIDLYDQVVGINVPPTVGLSLSTANLIQGVKAFYCEDLSAISLDGAPRPAEGLSLGSFSVNLSKFADVNGFNDKGNGTAKINPGQIDIANRFTSQEISYTFKSLLTGCQSSFDSTLYVAPKPLADFTYGSLRCVGQGVTFKAQYSFDNLAPATLTDSVKFSWSFKDPKGTVSSNSSNLQNPQHIYSAPSTVLPTMTVISKQGCASNLVTKTIQIGAIPAMAFTFSGVTGVNSDFITLTNRSEEHTSELQSL